MTTIQSIIIGVVEGLTEFLPISSTAHMRITENLLGISNEDKFSKLENPDHCMFPEKKKRDEERRKNERENCELQKRLISDF